MDRFIKLQRLEDSEELQYLVKKDHDAFVLLTVIAERARRLRTPHPGNGLMQFQAAIGDYKKYGLTEQRYRTAKKHLEKLKLSTFKSTHKGTVATLCNGRVFDINPEEANGLANGQPTDGQRTAND